MRERLIVALDVPNFKQAQKLVELLGDEVLYYKVGLELFLNSGGHMVSFLKQQQKKIFLDLKFHDIPNTVAAAARWATSLGVDMFNVHAGGGMEMLKQTKEAIDEVVKQANISPPLVIGVTVLTSFDQEGFQALGFTKSIGETVADWALMCKNAGLDGVVSSPLEAVTIKHLCGADFYTVCPGVRPLDAEQGDQKRVMTPRKALENGADYLVIGRPINQADNPLAAVKRIIGEMEDGQWTM